MPTVNKCQREAARDIVKSLKTHFHNGDILKMLGLRNKSYVSTCLNMTKYGDGSFACPTSEILKILEWGNATIRLDEVKYL